MELHKELEDYMAGHRLSVDTSDAHLLPHDLCHRILVSLATQAPTAALQEAVEALSDDDVRWVMKAVGAPIARARLVRLLRRVAAVSAGDLIGENDAQ